MPVIHISVDIEATGPTPGKYSMLSFGACVVGDTERSFYRELKPISENFIPEAIRIGSLGLAANQGNSASSKSFDPRKCLDNLRRRGVGPALAMHDFFIWVAEVAGESRPILASDTPVFDGMFIAWYFDNFCERGNPFHHTGLSMNCFCKGVTQNLRMNIKRLGFKAPKGVKHNALYDATRNAVFFQQLLDKHYTPRPR